MSDYNVLIDNLRYLAVGQYQEVLSQAADALIAAQQRLKEHEQFRHQHRDCDQMSLQLRQAQQRIAQFSATPEGGWFEAWRVADADRQQAQQRIAELEQDAKKAGYLRICCGKWDSCQEPCYPRGEHAGRLAGLRDAQAACTICVQPYCVNAIQALIDAAVPKEQVADLVRFWEDQPEWKEATADPACKSPESDAPSSPG